LIEVSDQLDWFIPKLLRIEDKIKVQEEIGQLDTGILIRNANSKRGIGIFKRGRAQRIKKMNELLNDDIDERITVFERLHNQKYRSSNVFERLIKEKHRV
jgi:hypothetical protein